MINSLSKTDDFTQTHKKANKNVKGVKSLKKYFRGFTLRTCLLLTP